MTQNKNVFLTKMSSSGLKVLEAQLWALVDEYSEEFTLGELYKKVYTMLRLREKNGGRKNE